MLFRSAILPLLTVAGFGLLAWLGWPAVLGRLDWPAIVLYAGAVCWTIGYDTIYAHQDREDDALVGVKSTARLFGARTRLALVCFYTVAVLLIGLSGAAAGAGPVFVLGCILFGAHLGWQIGRASCRERVYGTV